MDISYNAKSSIVEYSLIFQCSLRLLEAIFQEKNWSESSKKFYVPIAVNTGLQYIQYQASAGKSNLLFSFLWKETALVKFESRPKLHFY